MALPLAGSSWDCADAAAAAARAAAVRRGVPVNEDVQVGLVLRALWRHGGLADLFRLRTASTFDRYEKGIRVALYGGRQVWGDPPLAVSGCLLAKPLGIFWKLFPGRRLGKASRRCPMA